MIVTSMQLTISSRRDIAVLQKESSALEGEEDVNCGFLVADRTICQPSRYIIPCAGRRAQCDTHPRGQVLTGSSRAFCARSLLRHR